MTDQGECEALEAEASQVLETLACEAGIQRRKGYRRAGAIIIPANPENRKHHYKLHGELYFLGNMCTLLQTRSAAIGNALKKVL